MTFNGVGSGLDMPTAPDFAANDEKMRVIGAPHSRQADRGGAETAWIYSRRLEQGDCRRHCSARYSYIGMWALRLRLDWLVRIYLGAPD